MISSIGFVMKELLRTEEVEIGQRLFLRKLRIRSSLLRKVIDIKVLLKFIEKSIIKALMFRIIKINYKTVYAPYKIEIS